MIQFKVISRTETPPQNAKSAVFLKTDNWDDFSFVTMFYVYVFDENGNRHDLDNVKIGFAGQVKGEATHKKIGGSVFRSLPPGFFSVGTEVEYYVKLRDNFSEYFRVEFLSCLRDVAYNDEYLNFALTEEVFKVSHLRFLSINTLTGQFRRVAHGDVELTNFNFRFTLDQRSNRAGYQLLFDVDAESKPRSNIHAIIGRNGVGKTSLLNSMIRCVTKRDVSEARFEFVNDSDDFEVITDSYFSSIISVSFSAFDPFNPPEEQSDPTKGTCYFYIGLKSFADQSGSLLKSLNELYEEFIESLEVCLSEPGRRKRWLTALQTLESDDNFSEMNLGQLSMISGDERKRVALSLQKRMSSGHAIVLLTITKLVARIQEKTLVLFDEPESHLHPPLLSALIRCLSDLLRNRNAIAIVATHSPVVLQEIPKSSVWKISRAGLESMSSRLDNETFAENVGVLTRDVFGLEVSKSGFNALLAAQSKASSTYAEALQAFGNQVGYEGRAILRALIHSQGKK